MGALFLLALFFSPLAAVIPAEATAPALAIVGYFMMTIVKDIEWFDPGVGDSRAPDGRRHALQVQHHERRRSRFVSYTVIAVLRGKARSVHPLMYIVSAVFGWYFIHGAI